MNSPNAEIYSILNIKSAQCDTESLTNHIMTQVKLIKLTIKPGKKEVWLRWAEELQQRRDEVLATLQNERVVAESCFLSDDGEHVYYYMESEDLDNARNTSAQSILPIDKEHRAVCADTLASVAKLQCLFHFGNHE